LLTASHLTRRFGERIAVDDVSFDLRPGEIFGLLGPNGGGKTTTLRMLAGLIGASSGEVRMDGEPMNRQTSARLRRRIGFLTEAPGLWDQFSVRQNLMVYAKLHELDPPSRAVDRTMALLDIDGRANDSTATLSKGLKQRVALARALLHDPRVVLLDEPTSGLDPGSARGVREIIERLRREHRSVVLSTHNLDEVERLADRVAVLRGRMLAVDTPAALRTRFFGARVRIVLSQPAGPLLAAMASDAGVTADGSTVWLDAARTSLTTPELVRRLVDAGADIHAVAPEEPSLEEIYLKLVHQGEETR
jgi:ABC-2 type transport system ATP-binding protein